MKWILVVIVLLFLHLYGQAEGDVLTLTDENYDESIKKNKIIMVKFYAPWCGHCKAFAPEYEKAGRMIKEQNLPYVLADLDATVHKEAAGKNNIQGFPTIKLFLDGTPIDYDADRTAEAVIAFIKKKTSPPSTELRSAAEVKAIVQGKGLRAFYVGSNIEDIAVFTDVARGMDDYVFYQLNQSVAKEAGLEASAGEVLILKDFDEKKAIFKGKITKDALIDFLHEHILPTVTEINQKVIELIFKSGGKKSLFLFISPETKNAAQIEASFAKVAAKLKKDYIFVHTDIKEGWGKRVGDYFGIEESNLPVLEHIVMKDDIVRYKMNIDITEASLLKFVEDLKKDAVPRFLKSEPIPTENPGPVYKLVGKAFKTDILDNDNDILLKFYAPWCGHCKKLEPIYKSLAESLAVNQKLKFYEVDGTKNDIEGHQINGFPTLKFFPGKDKANPITYSGERNEEEIANFLKEKCSTPITIPEIKSKDEAEAGKDDL